MEKWGFALFGIHLLYSACKSPYIWRVDSNTQKKKQCSTECDIYDLKRRVGSLLMKIFCFWSDMKTKRWLNHFLKKPKWTYILNSWSTCLQIKRYSDFTEVFESVNYRLVTSTMNLQDMPNEFYTEPRKILLLQWDGMRCRQLFYSFYDNVLS